MVGGCGIGKEPLWAESSTDKSREEEEEDEAKKRLRAVKEKDYPSPQILLHSSLRSDPPPPQQPHRAGRRGCGSRSLLPGYPSCCHGAEEAGRFIVGSGLSQSCRTLLMASSVTD